MNTTSTVRLVAASVSFAITLGIVSGVAGLFTGAAAQQHLAAAQGAKVVVAAR